jgi:hypothetical protein
MYFCILVYNFFKNSPLRSSGTVWLFAVNVRLLFAVVNFSGRQNPQTKIIRQWFDNRGGVYINSTAAVVTPMSTPENKKEYYINYPRKYFQEQKRLCIIPPLSSFKIKKTICNIYTPYSSSRQKEIYIALLRVIAIYLTHMS